MDSARFFYYCVCGVRVDSLRTLHGLCTDSMRICGLLVDSARTPCGFVESVQSPQGQVGDCKVQEQSHICTHALQASHALCRLVDGDHKFSVETLKG
jgi:hypothetical protein